MKNIIFALFTAVGINSSLMADTLEYQATTDFSNINDGEVPYYRHNGISALAINAGNAAYRNKFARATTDFDGTAGVYDVTISALGELDGECEYRFLVNGIVAGTATNNRVDVDYEVQHHTFKNISIPANAEISVESNAVSNGLVPEHDIFAFARGRWITLTLQSDDTATTPVDLEISASTTTYSPNVGDTITIDIDIYNSNSTHTATNPVINLTVPSLLAIEAPSQCTVDGENLSCAVAEINPKFTDTFSLTAVAVAGGTADLPVSITADQIDNQLSNNNTTLTITSTDQTVTAAPVVDLAVSIDSDVTSAVVGDEINYTMTVVNQHASNVATSPVAGVLLPDSLSFSSSAGCSAINNAVTCSLAELAGGETAIVEFSATVNAAGDAPVVASASAAESEVVASDNEVIYSITAIESDRASTGNQVPNSTQAGTGGGYTSPLNLIGLYLVALFARRRK